MNKVIRIRRSRKVMLVLAVAGAVLLAIGYITNVFDFADNVNRVLGRESEHATGESIKRLEEKVERRPEYLADLPETQNETLRNAYEEARLLQLEGYQAGNAERHKEAVDRFTRALGLAENDAEMAALHILRGNSYLSIVGHDSSIDDIYSGWADYEEALRLADSISPDSDAAEPRAVALANLGFVYFRHGEMEKAEEYYQQALEIHSKIGNRLGEAQDLNSLGFVYDRLGEMDKAEQYYQQALEICREVSNRLCEARALNNLGFVYERLLEPEKAEEYYQHVLEIHKKIGNRLGEAQALRTLGLFYEQPDHLNKAEDYLKRALKVDRDIDNRRYEALELANLGRHYFGRGDTEKAEDYYQQALEIHREMSNRLDEARVLGYLGAMYKERGDLDKAREYFEYAQAIYDDLGVTGAAPDSVRQALEELER